jgi:hypothetical protein
MIPAGRADHLYLVSIHRHPLLKQCVALTLDQDISGILLGSAMKIAVTIGGVPYFKTSYRWGYGIDYLDAESPRANTED